MARKIELKRVMVKNEEQNYADWMLMILKHIPPGQGIRLDDMMRTMEVMKPIEEAKKCGNDYVVLEDTAWKLLCDKLINFPFGIFEKEIVIFGNYIRNIKEEGLN